MKKQILFLSIFLIIILIDINATIWTVSNNPDSPGQYTSLQTAIDNASPGDTILVSGSQINYGSINITKQIVLIGTGFEPINQFGFRSELSGIYFINNGSENGSGSVITGFYIGFDITSDSGVNDIIIERCSSGPLGRHMYIGGANWLIRQNELVYFIHISNDSNLYIVNNIIKLRILDSHKTDVIISNNIFIGIQADFVNVENAIISNNIFTGACPCASYVLYNSFNNNITYTGSTCNLPCVDNTGSGNINNTDPQFIPGTYHLSETSPGKNAGTDGTDIGIYGGMYPFVDRGIPPIPQIMYMNVENDVVPMNSDINVHIIGKKQD